MRAMLIAMAVLVTAGCGPADERERDAAACPVAETDRVSVTVRFEITGWEREPSRYEGIDLTASLESDTEPFGATRWDVKSLLDFMGERGGFGETDTMRSTRATITLAHGELDTEPVDSRTVTLDRNCDLLVEIAQSGDDPPRIDDVRWIPRE